MSTAKNFAKMLRWTTLILVTGNIVFNGIYNKILPQLAGMKEQSDLYHTLFTPAGYAFSIWGLIYASFLVYCIWQLLPSQLTNPTYDKISVSLMISNILGSVWIYTFTSGQIGLSVAIIFIMLITAMIMYMYTEDEFHKRFWHKFPFSIYMGWLSVATIANVAAWFVSMGWRGSYYGEATWGTLMTALAFMLGVYVGLKFKDIVFPLVISWALTAVWISDRMLNREVSLSALLAAIALVITALFIMAISKRYKIAKMSH